MSEASAPRHPLLPWLLTGLAIAAGALWLWLSGRFMVCDCGTIRLFAGTGDPKGVSQHVADWYTPSHIIHGFLFYAGLWLVAPRMALSWRLLLATVVEVAWELVENAPFIIERYRAVTVSVDYNGDTVLNSVADVLAMIAGFGLARVLPVWVSVAVVIGFEVLTAVIIRDGLALNVLMLLWPVQGVLDWQSAL